MIAPRQRAGRPDWVVIARREFLERVRSTWFVVVTLLGPILMIGMMVLPVVLATSEVRSKIEIVDHSGRLGEPVVAQLARLKWEGTVVPPDTTEATLLSRVASGRIDGFLTIPADGLRPFAAVDYQGDNGTSQVARLILAHAVTTAAQRVRALDAGLPADKLDSVLAPVLINPRHTTGETSGSSGVALLVLSYAVLIVLYMAIVLYATNVLRSVVQEKTNRVVEIMAAAAKPRALMIGKILGVGSVGLLQLAIWIVMAVVTMAYRGSILGVFGVGAGNWEMPPLHVLDVVVILGYFVLGYFLYASIFAAIGAMVSSDQEAQQAQTPIVMLLIIPMASVSVVSGQPRGAAAEILTQIPLSSPLLMPMRWLLGGASTASLAVSLATLTVTTVLFALLAGRIYRTGILMLGKRPGLRELWRWLRHPG